MAREDCDYISLSTVVLSWRVGASQSQSLQRQQFIYIYIYIFVIDLPSGHERPHLPRTCCHHLLCAVVRTIQEWQQTRPPNSERRDWRVVESNTDNDVQQKQPMQGRPVWNAREKVLGVVAQWNQLAIETPTCLKLDVTSGSEFPRKLPGRAKSSSAIFSGFEPHNSCDWRLNHGLLPLAKQ